MGSQLALVMMRNCCVCGCDDADNGWLEPGWVGCPMLLVMMMMMVVVLIMADNGVWVRRMLQFNKRFHNDNAMILRWAMF